MGDISLEQSNDAALMREAAKGERSAMSALWHKYHTPLLLSAQGKTDDAAELEKNTQAAFQYAFAVLQTGRQVANFYALLQICFEKEQSRLQAGPPSLPLTAAAAKQKTDTSHTAATPEAPKQLDKKQGRAAKKAKSRKPGVWKVIFLVLLNLLLLWLLAGLLMQKGILPKIDLGFDWLGKMYYRIF